MTTKSALQMTFLTDQNKKVKITVPSPKDPLDATAVQQAMDLIVAKNIFAFPQGAIVKSVSADEVQTNSNTIA